MMSNRKNSNKRAMMWSIARAILFELRMLFEVG
jgi:hypothetical protein